MYRLVLSAFPRPDSALFSRCHSGVAICWVDAVELDAALNLAREELSETGWRISKLEQATVASVSSPEEFHLASLARSGRVHCQVNVQHRLVVTPAREVIEGPEMPELGKQFADFTEELRRREAASLASDNDRAVTVKILEQDALVIWQSLEDELRWGRDASDDPPVKRVGLVELDAILRELDAALTVVALGLDNSLVTFDPAALREGIAKPSWAPWPLRR